MRYLLLLSTLLLTEQQVVLNTIQMTQPSYIQNYAIGYRNSSCVRISMFRFQSAASGQAGALTLNFVPEAQPNVGKLSVLLYSGTTVSVTTSIGLPLNLQFNTNVNQATYSLTNANWVFTSGTSYFLTFNTQDRLRMPYYTSSAGTTYSLTLQQAPQCNSTQWSPLISSGSVLPILINITNSAFSVSAINNNTPTITATNIPTNSPTSSVGLYPSNSPLNSPTMAESTMVPTITNTYASSNSVIYTTVTASVSAQAQSTSSPFSQIVSVSPSPSLPLNTIQGQAANTSYNPTAIAGYALGAIGLAVLLTCIINNVSKKRETPLVSSLVVDNPSRNLQPTPYFSNPVVSQNEAAHINPTNHWYRVVEGNEIYYYNDILKKSEWLLPEGGIIIGEGLPIGRSTVV